MAITKVGKEVLAASPRNLGQEVVRLLSGVRNLYHSEYLEPLKKGSKYLHEKATATAGKAPTVLGKAGKAIYNNPKAFLPMAVVGGAGVATLPANLRKNIVHADPETRGTYAKPTFHRGFTRSINYTSDRAKQYHNQRNVFF